MIIVTQVAIIQMELDGSIPSVKYVDTCIKFICNHARKDMVMSQIVESRLMKADPLIQPLSAPRMEKLRELFTLQYKWTRIG